MKVGRKRLVVFVCVFVWVHIILCYFDSVFDQMRGKGHKVHACLCMCVKCSHVDVYVCVCVCVSVSNISKR